MPKSFKLENLDPERPDLEYQGKRYIAALPDDFGWETEAQINTLTKRLLQIEMENKGIPLLETIARELKEIMETIVKIYFPTLPMDIIRTIPDTEKVNIMNWWGETCYPPFLSRQEKKLRKSRAA